MYSRKRFRNIKMKKGFLKQWRSSLCTGLMCGWLSFIPQISFSASHEQTWAEMIKTIKAVHLSTVSDRAVFQGGGNEVFLSRGRWNAVTDLVRNWNINMCHSFLFLLLSLCYFNDHPYFAVVLQMFCCTQLFKTIHNNKMMILSISCSFFFLSFSSLCLICCLSGFGKKGL